MLTLSFFSNRAVEAKIYSRTDILSEPRLQRAKHSNNRCQIIRATRHAGTGIPKTIAVRGDRKLRPKMHCANNVFPPPIKLQKGKTIVLTLPFTLHTSQYHAGAVPKFG